jgi:cardiolipin synthase A/B
VSLDAWSGTALTIAGYAGGVLTAAHALLYKKRNPSGALAWVAACLLLPFVGAVLYLMIGHDQVTRRRRRRIRAAHRAFYEEARTGRRAARKSAPPDDKTLSCVLPTVQRLVDSEVHAGNAVEIDVDARRAYDRMVEAIRSAKRSVSLQTFIFDADEIGRRFVDALQERARAGVRIRVLFDAVGTGKAGARLISKLSGPDVQFDAFLPFHPFKRRFQINLRNHRKIMVVDDALAFTGSMNISARHLRDDAAGSRDLVLEIAGPVVRDLADVFAADWQFATGERLNVVEATAPEPPGDETLQFVESGPDHVDRGALHVILASIYAAQRDILILTPYFIPPPELLTALQTAAARGVRVRLVIPGRFGSNYFMYWAMRSYLPPLEREKAEIAEGPGALLHMKMLVVDDAIAVVGSTNLDYRSFYLNFEADVVVYGGALQAALRKLGEAEWNASPRLKDVRFEKMHLLRRMGIRFVALFSPVL